LTGIQVLNGGTILQHFFQLQSSLLITLIFISLSNVGCSHTGGVEKAGIFKGCHTQKSTGEFHCHGQSVYNGQSWEAKEEAIKNIQGPSDVVSSALIKIKETKYKREDWKHWIDEDGDCEDTRTEILKDRSLAAVKMDSKRCTVLSGKWDDYYYQEILYQALEVDIDHLVPLKHAHDHGGSHWSLELKRKFANDPENLIITNLKYNRQKGSRDITQWLPVDRYYACKYMNQWFKIKMKYHLIVKDQEKEYLDIAKCDNVLGKNWDKL